MDYRRYREICAAADREGDRLARQANRADLIAVAVALAVGVGIFWLAAWLA